MNHIWTQISYSYPKQQRFAWVKKEKNVVKLQEVIFAKITQTARLPGTEFSTDKG